MSIRTEMKQTQTSPVRVEFAPQRSEAPPGPVLLQIRDLELEFGSREKPLRAVDGLSLTIGSGETLCLVGESGCGKSVTALSIARLLPSPPARYTRGQILLHGRDVLRMNASELRSIRGAT